MGRFGRAAVRAAPFVAAAVTFAVVFLLVTQPWADRSHVATERRSPATTNSTSPGAPEATGSSASTGDAVAGGSPSSTAPLRARSAPTSTARPGTTIAPDADCVPAGTQQPQPRHRCWQTSTSPKGNYNSSTSARGCVVHNTGASTPAHDELRCSYDAAAAGGYSADGDFNMIRIVRNGKTINIDGFAAPRCATNLIQPGDHVYVDGRNQFDDNGYPSTTPSGGYTTVSVGDDFHC